MDTSKPLTYRIIYEVSQYRQDKYIIEFSENERKTWSHDGSYNDLYEAVGGIIKHLYLRERSRKPFYKDVHAESFEIMELYNIAQERSGTIAIVGDHPAYDSTNTFDTNEDFSVRLFDLLKVRSK